MHEDLMEPCPFCGEAYALSCTEVALLESWYVVFCQSCGAEGPQSDSEPEALESWNKRPGKAPMKEELLS